MDTASKRSSGPSQNYRFSKTQPDPRPATRDSSASCRLHDKVYIFGGAIFNEKLPVPVESNDFWVFDLKTHNFQQLKPVSGKTPEKRASCALAGLSHQGKDYVYLFGGITELSGWLDDFWRFDLEAKTWERIEVSNNAPGNRSMHSLTKIQRPSGDQLLLFGGFGPAKPAASNGGSTSKTSAEGDGDDEWEDVKDGQAITAAAAQQEAFSLTRFNDSYLFDPESNSWTLLVNPECPSPSPRAAHKVVSLSQSSKAILFGGRGELKRLNDTWEFDCQSLSWRQLGCNENLEPRSFHELCLDSESDRVFVHGGRDDKNNHLSSVQEVYPNYCHIPTEFSLGGHMFFECFEGKFLLFGGSDVFEPEIGGCLKFYNDLVIGEGDSKRMKMAEAEMKAPESVLVEKKSQNGALKASGDQ